MNYEFSMTINDSKRMLSPTNGIGIEILGNIIVGLNLVTDPGDNSVCVLTGISNHGYTPEFKTNSERRYGEFVNVHRHLIERGISDLTPKELKYQRTLKANLKGGLYLEAHDIEHESIGSIYPSKMKEEVDGYYSVTTVYGVISETGSPSLGKNTHIYLHELDYKIFTNPQQDKELNKYYRSGRLALKVRQKCSLISGKVINASLLDFYPMNAQSFPSSLSSLSNEDLNFLNNIKNQDELFDFLGK